MSLVIITLLFAHSLPRSISTLFRNQISTRHSVEPVQHHLNHLPCTNRSEKFIVRDWRCNATHEVHYSHLLFRDMFKFDALHLLLFYHRPSGSQYFQHALRCSLHVELLQ